MSVWILVLFTYSNTPAIIDNLASYEECNRVSIEIRKQARMYDALRVACIEVKKVRSW